MSLGGFKMDFIDNLVASRLGGSNFFSEDKLFKFEKLKRIRDELKVKYPDVKIIDMGVGEPDRKADESIVSGLAGVFHVVPKVDFYCLHGHSPDISVPNVQSSFQPFFC